MKTPLRDRLGLSSCTYPVGAEGDPCRKPAVAVYIVGGERYWRCAKHDGPKVRAQAEDRGYARFPIEGMAA